MTDDVLAYLRQARSILLEERDAGKNSRELSIVLTEIDTAILWRQHDLQLKTPVSNQYKNNSGVSDQENTKQSICASCGKPIIFDQLSGFWRHEFIELRHPAQPLSNE